MFQVLQVEISQDIYMVSFHPLYGKGRSIETGDVIEVGDQQATVRDRAAGGKRSF